MADTKDENFRVMPDESARSRLRWFFIKHGFPSDVVEELTQETWLRVYKNLGKLRGRSDGEFANWLMRIADNVRCDYFRKQGRIPPSISLDDADNAGPAAQNIPDARANPLQAMLRAEEEREFKENCARVRQVFDEMPDKMRECMKLRWWQERTYKEIAIVLDISVDTVKSHLKAGMKRLREKLGFWPDDQELD